MFRPRDSGSGFFAIIAIIIYGTIFLLRKKIKYFLAPDTVIKKKKRDNILLVFHIFPTIILALLTVLKILPLLPYFSEKLKENNIIIPISILSFIIIFSFLIGLLIEKLIERNNNEFKIWKYNIKNTNKH